MAPNATLESGGVIGALLMPSAEGRAAEFARYLLQRDFTAAEQALVATLAAKSSAGTISAAERETLLEYAHADRVLCTLQAQARRVLAAAGGG